MSFPDGFAKPGYTLADFQSQQALFDWLKLEEVATFARARMVVAVIDTGVDYTHPALAANLWQDARDNADIEDDRMDNDGDGLVDDARGWDFVDNDNDPWKRQPTRRRLSPVTALSSPESSRRLRPNAASCRFALFPPTAQLTASRSRLPSSTPQSRRECHQSQSRLDQSDRFAPRRDP